MPLAPDERKLISSEKIKQKYSNKSASKEASVEAANDLTVLNEPPVAEEETQEPEDSSKSALELLRQKLQVNFSCRFILTSPLLA